MTKIEINPETGDASIDRDTIDRLTQGTPFQRSMNMVAMIDELLSEFDADFAKAAGLNRNQRRAYKKAMKKSRAAGLRANIPPMANFDPSAIDVFYD